MKNLKRIGKSTLPKFKNKKQKNMGYSFYIFKLKNDCPFRYID